MKTTIDLPDSLLEELRRAARRQRTTMRALVEQALRRALAEKREPREFRLRRVTFGGEGLVEDLAGASWDQVRRRAYEGRGE